ncbi:hypothetical protein HYV84_00230 [Candidatus Woesearchaeota archaeon]|nr:hypothetical protein [Candidatus Woesearchaeota archaeon]
MERGVSDLNILEKFALEFTHIVEQYGRYIIVSGFVAIVHGRSRATEDIDMILERISKEKFVQLHAHLEKEGFECIQGENPVMLYDEYLAQNTPLRYIRKGMPLPDMEIKLAKDKLDELQLQERTKLPMTNLPFWFSSIETNIAFKEEYLKSPKDLEDARHLRVLYEGILNEEQINRWKVLIKKVRL